MCSRDTYTSGPDGCPLVFLAHEAPAIAGGQQARKAPRGEGEAQAALLVIFLLQKQINQSSTLGRAKAVKPFLGAKAAKPFLGTQATHPSLCAGTRDEELVQVLGIVEQFLRSGYV